MIQLYQYEVCPYCCKVKSVLDYKRVPYEKIEVNPMTHEELSWNKKAYDHDKVPVLIDGQETVLESNDIIRYLDERFPKKPIFAKDRAAAARQDAWIRFADDESAELWRSMVGKKVNLVPLRGSTPRAREQKAAELHSHYAIRGPLAFLHVHLIDNRSDVRSGKSGGPIPVSLAG